MNAGIQKTYRATLDRSRKAPAEIRDGVELWARKHGRTGDVKWYDAPMNCWAVRLGYRPNDPRARDGSKHEVVFLHEWKSAEWWAENDSMRARRHHRTNRIMPAYRAFDLDELGLGGVIEFLDRGDLLSGRGEFSSAAEAGRVQVEKFRDEKHRRRREAQDNAAYRAKHDRRKFLNIPLIGVGIEFTPKEK